MVESGPFKVVNIADYETLRETLTQEVFNSRGNYSDLFNGKPPLRGGTEYAYYPGIVDAEGMRYVWIVHLKLIKPSILPRRRQVARAASLHTAGLEGFRVWEELCGFRD